MDVCVNTLYYESNQYLNAHIIKIHCMKLSKFTLFV